MDRRRGLATSAAIAVTVASGAMAVWPGLGLWNSDRPDPVGQFRPVASQAPAPQVVQVGVPPAGTAVQSAVPGTTAPGGAPGSGATRPGGDDAGERACAAATSTTPGGREVEYGEHDPGYGSCSTQTTRPYEDDRFDD